MKAEYDAEVAVGFVESSDLEGVTAEASSLEALLQKLPGSVLDLLEEEGLDDVEVPIEVVARASTRVRRSTTVRKGDGKAVRRIRRDAGCGRAAVTTRSGRARTQESHSPCRWPSHRDTQRTKC